MMSYDIKYSKSEKYSVIIYSISYINPIQDLKSISSEIKLHYNDCCYVLFDMLLSNGDEFNRFAEGYFDGNEIKFETIKIINKKNIVQLRKINDYYRKNANLLNNSVLSLSEKIRYAI